MTRDELARTLGELGARHSPSGVEESVDEYLTERLSALGAPVTDTAGNIVLRIEGASQGRCAPSWRTRTRSGRW